MGKGNSYPHCQLEKLTYFNFKLDLNFGRASVFLTKTEFCKYRLLPEILDVNFVSYNRLCYNHILNAR